MSRGGKRPGAGRKPSPYTGRTKALTLRIPEADAQAFLAYCAELGWSNPAVFVMWIRQHAAK